MTHTADAAQARRWTARLLQASMLKLIFMRLLSLGFLGLGLYRWAQLLGAVHDGSPDFFTLTLQAQAVVLFFAVADLVAAIGLWLTATWGVVVWFATAGARIVRHTVFAGSFGWAPIATAADSLGVILFILLIVLETRAARREIIRQRETRRNRARD